VSRRPEDDDEDLLRQSGADGYALAVELLPLVAWRGVAHHDQRHLLSELNELALNAASSAIQAGRPSAPWNSSRWAAR
jgi:hypothetical protein